MFFHYNHSSKNSKTGQIPVIMSSSNTCPDACSFKKSFSCYAKFHFLGLHWNKLDKGKIGGSFTELVNKIRNIPENQLFRLNQAGDLPGVNNKINIKMLKRLVSAAKNRPVLSYTHKLVLGNSRTAINNRKYIKWANKHGFNINISADGLRDADKKANLKIGPVCVVLPSDSPNKLFTPQGKKVIVCPAQYKNLTCDDCRLCSKNHSCLIGFRAHSSGKSIVNKLVKN
jgi:hypothetical protein